MSATKVIVEVRNGDINKALKLLKRKTINSGHLQLLRDNKEYIKPSAEKRKKKMKAIRLNKLNLQIENEDI